MDGELSWRVVSIVCINEWVFGSCAESRQEGCSVQDTLDEDGSDEDAADAEAREHQEGLQAQACVRVVGGNLSREMQKQRQLTSFNNHVNVF